MKTSNPDYTSREAQVALLLARGHTCREIAVTLHLGYETVRDTVKRLRDKTGLRRNTALAAWAAENRRELEKRK